MKKGNAKKKNNESEDLIEFDFTKIKNGYNYLKNNEIIRKYSYLLLIIIPIFLAAFFRLYPATLPATDDWAKDSVYNSIKNNMKAQINQQFSNLPDSKKQELINENFAKYYEQNKKQIDASIEQTSKHFKNQLKNENGETYLLAIDPYYYYRQVRNMVEKGHVWDEIEDGQPKDNHMLAPNGRNVPKKFKGGDLHVWISTLFHKFISIFNKDITVMGSFFFIPVILSVLSVIPAFFIGRKAGGVFGGLIASIMVGIHPAFIGRTAGGFSDTDAYNILFPLLISWFVIEAIDNKNFYKKIFFSAGAGLCVGLYSFAWAGWWYIFDFLLIALIGYIIYNLILYRDVIKKGIKKYFTNENIKNSFIILLVFVLISGIFVSFFGTFSKFTNGFSQPIERLTFKDSAKADLWPNVFTTVAELNEVSLNSIVNQIGGKLMFMIALMGIVFTLLSKDKRFKKKNIIILGASFVYLLILMSVFKNLGALKFIISLMIPIVGISLYYLYKKVENIDIFYAIFFTVWFFGTIYTTSQGIRFLLLLVPVYGLSFGITIGKAYQIISDYFSKHLDVNKIVSKVIVIAVLSLLLIAPLKTADKTGRSEIPSMNDGWYFTLNKIDKNASSDAIINSWWDFGHWFKAIGDRAVTFDGASQNTPMAHWIGKSLLTNDEDEAIGILRMLDCGSNDAYELLKENDYDIISGTELLYDIIVMDKEDASLYLDEKGVEFKDKLLDLTHCNPPENYYITSQDMIGKSGVWAHFGSWDFKRAKIWNEYRKLPMSEFMDKADDLGYDDDEAEKIYFEIQSLSEGRAANTWIAPWPSYASSVTNCNKNEEIIACQSGLVINKTNMDAYIQTRDGKIKPKKFSYIDNNTFVVKENLGFESIKGNDGSFIGASLINDSGKYKTVLMQADIVDSMFNRLFYYDGVGLSGFEKFTHVKDFMGQNIITWKINWEN